MSTKVILGMNVFHEEEEKSATLIQESSEWGEVVEKDTESDGLHSFNPSSLKKQSKYVIKTTI